MNFCFINTLSGFGGLEIQNILRANDSIRLGHSALVIVSSRTRSKEFAMELNLPTIQLNPKFFYFNLNFARNLANIFSSHQIDICIVPKSELLFSCILAKKLSKRPIAVVFYQQMQSGINKRDPYHNFIYRNLDSAIVLTERMKNDLQNTTVLPPDRVFVVPYGIDSSKFQSIIETKSRLRQEYDLPSQKFIVGCIGRIEPLKGQMVLVESFARANLPNSALVLAGAIDNADYFLQIQKRINEYGLSNSFYYKEFTKDVPKLMQCLDLFVLPSNSETFGLVVIEAMASGVPVIATNSGGISEIITDRVDGLLFEPKNVDQLANLLTIIFQNKELVERITRNAQQKIQVKFDYQKNVSKFFEICELVHKRMKG